MKYTTRTNTGEFLSIEEKRFETKKGTLTYSFGSALRPEIHKWRPL